MGERIVGNMISQDLRGELIDIVLVQGHWVQFGVPTRSHWFFSFFTRQILLGNSDHHIEPELALMRLVSTITLA